MTDEDSLKHYGVKGMHWGKRKASTSTADKKVAKADKKFESISTRYNRTFDVASDARKSIKSSGDLKRINDKYSAQLTNSFSKNRQVKKAYTAETQRVFLKHLQKAADAQGTNASGTRKVEVIVNPKRPDRWIVSTTEIKHADETVEVQLTFDKNGFITDIQPVKDLQQTGMDVDEFFLEHYGVKGMHWGSKKKKNPASSDAAAATTTRTTAKKKGVHTVSNADLQSAIRRMQLEQDFKRLSVNQKSAASRWVSSTLLEIGKREVQQQVTKKIAATVAKKVVTGGAA